MEDKLTDRHPTSLLPHGCNFLTVDEKLKAVAISKQMQRDSTTVKNYPSKNSTESVGYSFGILKSTSLS
jgi:hypothetical protein